MSASTAQRATHPGTGTVFVSPAGRQNFRPDIEGLRAIAVMLVLLTHAGVPFLPGGFVGVDVFFVISGFLITSRIRDEIGSTGRFSLARFYAARVERLLPAAIFALYAVLVMMFLFLPKIRWRDTAFDIAASGSYWVNWRLADRATDYFASGTAPSAVQHFWSLAVEEQYYLLCPLLFLIILAVARKRRWKLRQIWQPLLICLAVVSAVSLTWSVFQTAASPLTSYFDTTTRLWELGIGSCLAIAVLKRKFIKREWREPLAVTGLASIGVSALLFGGSTGFPGYAALLPTVGTALILFAGETSTQHPRTLGWLRIAPMQTVGALSYSLYLWHWPLLVIFAAKFGQLPVLAGLAVTALSFIPAYFSYRLIEQPIRTRRWLRNSPWNALVAAVAGAMVTIVPALAIGSTTGTPAPRPATSLDKIVNGAAVLAADPLGDVRGAPTDQVPSIEPDPAAAPKDGPDVDRDGCFSIPADSGLHICEYGDRASSFKVVLAGDSHAVQWQPAVRAVAEARGWHLLVFGKSACPLAETTVLSNHKRGQAYTECAAWNEAARKTIAEVQPDLIITTSYRFVVWANGKALLSNANQEARIAAMRATWSNLAKPGTAVVVLRDTPLPPFDVADCVSGNLQQLTKCAFDRDQAVTGFGDDQVAAAAGLPGVHLLDFTSAICPVAKCAPVIGGVLVFRDKDHLTATYALSLAPRLLAALEAVTKP